MESLIEKLIVHCEQIIREDYEWLSSCSWSEITHNTVVPNRNSIKFVDMAMTRLVIKYGFAKGTKLAFKIQEYLNKDATNE